MKKCVLRAYAKISNNVAKKALNGDQSKLRSLKYMEIYLVNIVKAGKRILPR